MQKTAVVTGAAQGLGLVTARRLAEAGYRVVLLDIQPLEVAVAETGGDAFGIAGDISREDHVEAVAKRLADEFGGADVLVNNAGISMIEPAEDTSLAQWQRMMEVNLQGPFLLCRALGRQMLARGSGAIVTRGTEVTLTQRERVTQ